MPADCHVTQGYAPRIRPRRVSRTQSLSIWKQGALGPHAFLANHRISEAEASSVQLVANSDVEHPTRCSGLLSDNGRETALASPWTESADPDAYKGKLSPPSVH